MKMVPAKWTSMSSSLSTFLYLFKMFHRFCPNEFRRFLYKISSKIRAFLYPYIEISIHEFSHLRSHEAYKIIQAYLSAISVQNAKMLKAEMLRESNKFVLSMDEYEEVTDEFNGIKIWWTSGKSIASSSRSMSYFLATDRRFYKLLFHKKHREMISEAYLEHVIKKGKEIKARNRQRKLYTISRNDKSMCWSHRVFEHPATFDTLAMEPWKKQEIIEDLQTFTKSKDYYSRIGKAWKRGYLLYGPPGTGKSTMIAAMANLLDYDVYDIELTSVRDNSELRELLTETANKSIIVIEDIDCSLDLTGQRKMKSEYEKGKKEENGSKVTLSGLLNFTDGLWSTCGGERLIVFTTNHVDKLDLALTRRGRMDKHIELSYCNFEGFKVLARNYLMLEEEKHPLFPIIEQLMMETKITPADVAENLMPKSTKEDPDKCLKNLIQAMEEAKGKQEALEDAKSKQPQALEDAKIEQQQDSMNLLKE